MENQLPKALKSERGRTLATIEAEMREAYFRSLLDTPLEVLCESPDKDNEGRYVGTTCRYAPVSFSATTEQVGQLLTVRPHTLHEGMLVE